MRRGAILAATAILVAMSIAATAGADDDAKKEKKPKEPTAAQLKIAKAMAEDNLRSKITQQAADGAEAIESMVPHGTRIVSAQHTATDFEMFVCPDKELQALVATGAAVAGVISAKGSGSAATL